MSVSDDTRYSGDEAGAATPVGGADEPTLPQPVVRWDLPPDTAGVMAPAPEAYWEWPGRSRKAGIRVRIPMAILVVLLCAAGGLWGGAALQRTRTSSTAASALSSAAANLFRNRGTAAGTAAGGSSPFAGRGSTGSAAAAGLVTTVEGNVLYITTSSGSIEKVTVSGTTTVTRDAKTSLASLVPGDTVVVQGTKQANGDVSATSVTATASGVSAGGGAGLFGGSGSGGARGGAEAAAGAPACAVGDPGGRLQFPLPATGNCKRAGVRVADACTSPSLRRATASESA